MSKHKNRNQEILPQNQNRLESKSKSMQLKVSTFQGPIPSPEILQQYETIHPGTADRIIRMAETQIEHRHAIEKSVVKSQTSQAWLGQWLAFFVAIAMIAASVLMIAMGLKAEGVALIIIEITSMIGIFLYAKRSDRIERQEKWKATQETN